MSAREAFEVDPFDTENESLLKDVAKRLPERERRVLMEEGAQGLMEFMEDEAFARAPEFLKPRPKWFYYYEWCEAGLWLSPFLSLSFLNCHHHHQHQ